MQKEMKRIYLSVILVLSVLSVSGCNPSYSTEMTVSLTPPVSKTAKENPKPINALDTLAAVEKIAAANNLKRYTPDTAETSLLDLADTDDLMDESSSTAANTTYYKHTELPVYLSVTRNQNDILVLVNHTPDESGKPIPEAKKLYDLLQKQLTDQLPQQ